MKKYLSALLCSIGVVFFFGSTSVFASESELDLSSSEEINSVQSAVQSYLSPSKLSGKNLTYYTLKVSTNVGGTSGFYFNPGDGSGTRTGNAVGTRNFSHSWSVSSLKKFTTSARVISQDYGPGPWTYGTATISY